MFIVFTLFGILLSANALAQSAKHDLAVSQIICRHVNKFLNKPQMTNRYVCKQECLKVTLRLQFPFFNYECIFKHYCVLNKQKIVSISSRLHSVQTFDFIKTDVIAQG